MSDKELYDAATVGNVADVQRLIAEGADANFVNEQDKKRTPLLMAVVNNNVEAMKLLIEAKANPNAEGFGERSPLHWAAYNGNVEATKVLIEAKANIHAEDDSKATPLHYAAMRGHVDAMKVLIDAKANPNAEDKDKETPLHYAANEGNVEATKVLIEAKANPNAENEDKATPLHLAAYYGNVEATKVLIEAKANIHAEDTKKWTPLHWAAENGNVEAMKALIAKANIEGCNDMLLLPTFDFEAVASSYANGDKMLSELFSMLKPKAFTASRPPDVDAFAHQPATMLYGLVKGSAYLTRYSQRVRASDATAADNLVEHSQRLLQVGAALLRTIEEADQGVDQEERLVPQLMSMGKGRAMLLVAVRQSRKILVAQPCVQAVLRARWDGASEALLRQETGALARLFLFLSVCSSLISLVVPPLFEATVAAASHPLARVLLLVQGSLLLSFWRRPFPTEMMSQGAVTSQGEVLAVMSPLAAWSLLLAAAPTTLAGLVGVWWVRLLVALVACLAAAAIAVKLGWGFLKAEREAWAGGLVGSLLAPLIVPLLAAAVTVYIGCSMLAVALVPSLEKSASLPSDKRTEMEIFEWYQENSAVEYFVPSRRTFLFPLTTMLLTPKAKFIMASASRTLLAFLLATLTLSTTANEPSSGSDDVPSLQLQGEAPPQDQRGLPPMLVCLWVVAAIADEGAEFWDAPDLWLADDLNLLETPGLALAFIGTAQSVVPLPVAITLTPRGIASVLACSVVLILCAQGLRLLQSSSELGPLVLMVQTMVKVDLVNWLILTTAGVVIPFAAGLYRIFYEAEMSLDGECAGMDAALSGWSNVWVLTKVLVGGGGEAYVDCFEGTKNSIAAPMLFELYLLFTVVLLLNLLIALFAKTFDIIFEQQSINYQYLFARNTMNAEQRSMVPAPLNLLSMPYWLWRKATPLVALWRTGERSWHTYAKLVEDGAAETTETVEDDIDLTKHEVWRKANPLGSKATLEKGETTVGDDEGDDQQKTLTEKVLEFLSDPANEEEQEGMHRRQLRKSIGELRKDMGKQSAKTAEQSTKLAEQSTKLAEQSTKLAEQNEVLKTELEALRTDLGAKLERIAAQLAEPAPASPRGTARLPSP